MRSFFQEVMEGAWKGFRCRPLTNVSCFHRSNDRSDCSNSIPGTVVVPPPTSVYVLQDEENLPPGIADLIEFHDVGVGQTIHHPYFPTHRLAPLRVKQPRFLVDLDGDLV